MFSLGMICPWYVVDFYHASSLGILFFTSRYKWYEFGGRISPHYGCLQWTYCIYLHDIYVWLVVSNMAFIFHNIWDVILPIDFHIFQDGQNHQPDDFFSFLFGILFLPQQIWCHAKAVGFTHTADLFNPLDGNRCRCNPGVLPWKRGPSLKMPNSFRRML